MQRLQDLRHPISIFTEGNSLTVEVFHHRAFGRKLLGRAVVETIESIGEPNVDYRSLR